jgi:hypothetical protein
MASMRFPTPGKAKVVIGQIQRRQRPIVEGYFRDVSLVSGRDKGHGLLTCTWGGRQR